MHFLIDVPLNVKSCPLLAQGLRALYKASHCAGLFVCFCVFVRVALNLLPMLVVSGTIRVSSSSLTANNGSQSRGSAAHS